MHVAIRDLEPRDADACDAIVAGLPEWFGNEQGTRDCARAVRSQAGLVAIDETGVTGFLTWTHDRNGGVAEITWMAVRAASRRRGIGRSLLSTLIERLRQEQVRLLDVKTLSERATYPPYAETRAFYLANGFEWVAELDIWDEGNPAVLLRRRL
ncbi:MAG: GNAT family N-acetyltransferase [Actinobacteria bacterium]|nr:MAG: GNAT family N-acetyltransferase [Actinomycetota bacterium]